MKITIESTGKFVELEGSDGVLPARVWQGRTEGGIEVIAFITRIAAARDADLAEFERDLQEHAAPVADVAAWPRRMFLP